MLLVIRILYCHLQRYKSQLTQLFADLSRDVDAVLCKFITLLLSPDVTPNFWTWHREHAHVINVFKYTLMWVTVSGGPENKNDTRWGVSWVSSVTWICRVSHYADVDEEKQHQSPCPPTLSLGMRRSSEPCFRNTFPAVWAGLIPIPSARQTLKWECKQKMQKIQERKTVIQKTSKEIRNKMYSITGSFAITVHSTAKLTAKKSIWNNDRRAIFLLIKLKLLWAYHHFSHFNTNLIFMLSVNTICPQESNLSVI